MYRQSLIIIYDEIVHIVTIFIYDIGKGHFIIYMIHHLLMYTGYHFSDLKSNAGVMYMYVIY